MAYSVDFCKWIIFVSFAVCVSSLTITLPECLPPDYPQSGGYGPRKDAYEVGDIIHYFCDSDTYIGGNYVRRCEDNGDWSGDTPVCDAPAEFSRINQTSSTNPAEENGAELAADGDRTTCSSTRNGNNQYWMALFREPGELIRVMAFMPRGDVSYEVLLLKERGQTLSCGTVNRRIDRLEWAFHNCPGPNNRDAIGVQIRSLSPNIPLRICELVTHVLSTPTCTDPRLQIDNGRIQLTRKVASLVCNPGYTRSPNSRISCWTTGVWERKSMYCLERQWETGSNRDPFPDADP